MAKLRYQFVVRGYPRGNGISGFERTKEARHVRTVERSMGSDEEAVSAIDSIVESLRNEFAAWEVQVIKLTQVDTRVLHDNNPPFDLISPIG